MTISIIIPAYNEEKLITLTVKSVLDYFKKNRFRGEIIIINDGSTDTTSSIIESMIPHITGHVPLKLINNPKNRGKGFSIKRGMSQSAGEIRIFMDADLPFGLGVIDDIVERIKKGADIVIGDRNDPQSKLVEVRPIRKLAGNVYSKFIQTLVKGGITDTQCGLKGFSANAARFIFPRTTINGFGFDVEVLRIAQKKAFSIKRIPVQMLRNRQDSRVHLIQDSLLMLWNLAVIRWNEMIGKYD